MAYGLEITPYIQQNLDPYADSIRVRIEVTNAVGLSPKVFLYLARPLQAGQTEADLEFQGVCSPVDLEEVPEDAPLPNADPAWARLNYVDLLFRARSDAFAFIETLQGELQQLISALNDSDKMSSLSSYWIGSSV